MVTTFAGEHHPDNYEEILIDHPQDWSERISRTLAQPKRNAIERQHNSELYIFDNIIIDSCAFY